MQNRPEEHTQLRLATQLEVGVHAVRVRAARRGVAALTRAQAWFRSRRLRSRRARKQAFGMCLSAFIFGVCLIALIASISADAKRKKAQVVF